jgi:hypothetical protein
MLTATEDKTLAILEAARDINAATKATIDDLLSMGQNATAKKLVLQLGEFLASVGRKLDGV